MKIYLVNYKSNSNYMCCLVCFTNLTNALLLCIYEQVNYIIGKWSGDIILNDVPDSGGGRQFLQAHWLVSCMIN